MNISLFVPCYVDQFFPNIAISILHIFERLGHTVSLSEKTPCCGQPPFNTGHHHEARKIAAHVLQHLEAADVIVTPSGSCAAMLKNSYPELFEGQPLYNQALALSQKTWEFSEFLTEGLGVTDLGARFPARVTFHDGCHGLRHLGIKSAPRVLLSHVRELNLVEMDAAETCCGFGGAFSIKFSDISTSMAEVKCASILKTSASYLVSNDPSCLMQIQGYLDIHHHPIQSLHLAEVLAQQ